MHSAPSFVIAALFEAVESGVSNHTQRGELHAGALLTGPQPIVLARAAWNAVPLFVFDCKLCRQLTDPA